MATIKQATSNDEQLDLTINNGDFIALKDIVEKYSFKDEASAIRFALALLSKSEGKGLYIKDEEGVKLRQVPGESLLKDTKSS